MTRRFVLGGGLTGLSTAWHLAERGLVAPVLEAESEPGGACRTYGVDGFHFDLTGHLLHLERQESRSMLDALGLSRSFRTHQRRASVALAGRFAPYPIQIHMHTLPREIRRDCLLGAIEARLRASQRPGEVETFADWVLHRFGDGLARHFFFPYNRKLFRAEPRDLTTEWVGRFVPRPDLAAMVDGAFGLYRHPVGYNSSFLYPRRGGIRALPDALARSCPDVRLHTRVVRLDCGRRTMTLESGTELAWDRLVATCSLAHLAAMTSDLSAAAGAAAQTLRSVAVVNFNLGVRGRAPRRDHWIYVPEPGYPFYRVGIPSNHGRLARPGSHTLSVEVSVPSGSEPPQSLLDECLAGLERLGLLRSRADVETAAVARIDPAYVVFDAARTAAVGVLRTFFAAAGVRLAGRWAEWKYSAMEDALHDGAAAAEWVAS